MCICRAGENDLPATLDGHSRWRRCSPWVIMDDINAPQPEDAEERRARIIKEYKRIFKDGMAGQA